MLWVLGTPALSGCAHPGSPPEYLARAPFVGSLDAGDGVLSLSSDHTAWFLPGGTADYDGERFHWHLQGPSIFLEFRENDERPDRVAVLVQDGREYLVPWSDGLCAALPTLDWSNLASTWGTLSRPASGSDPLPHSLDVCIHR